MKNYSAIVQCTPFNDSFHYISKIFLKSLVLCSFGPLLFRFDEKKNWSNDINKQRPDFDKGKFDDKAMRILCNKHTETPHSNKKIFRQRTSKNRDIFFPHFVVVFLCKNWKQIGYYIQVHFIERFECFSF